MSKSLPFAALLLGLLAPACAAPVDDSDGSSSAAATDASGVELSAEDVEALSGKGLRDCSEDLGDAVLCAYPRGFAVISPSGIALIEAKGDVVTAKALSKRPGRGDIADVVAAADAPSDVATASLRPLGWATGAVRAIAAAALGKTETSAAKAVVTAGVKEAEVSAVHAPTLANKVATLPSATVARAGANGATEFTGPTCVETLKRVRTLAESQNKWPVAIGSEAFGFATSPATIASGIAGLEQRLLGLKATAEKVEQGLVLVLPLEHTAFDQIVAMARRIGVEVVQIGGDKPLAGVAAHAKPDVLDMVRTRDLQGFPYRFAMTANGPVDIATVH